MKFRDSCPSNRREVSDLLRWSTGQKQRNGKEYVEFKSPINPANKAPSPSDKAKNFGVRVLTVFLRWVLSGKESPR